jgi:ribulose-phosphate 3-epimerase
LKVSASILAADLADIYGSSKRAVDAGVDLIHLDVMDGHFVPNLTFGAQVAADLKKRLPDTPMDAHLMITEPNRYAMDFVKAGCAYVAFHAEASGDPFPLIARIRNEGGHPGMVVNPGTSEEFLKPFARTLDYVLFMSVNPGFAGQKFMPQVVAKLARFSRWCKAEGLSPELAVDGGVSPENAADLSEAGATILVASAALYRAPDMAAAVRSLKNPK